MKLADRIRAVGMALRGGNEWQVLLDILRNTNSASGVAVNETTSLNFSAVWAAMELVSGTMSTVPLQVFSRTGSGRNVLREHPLYSVLHDQANRIESAQAFREVFTWNMEMRGIGLAEKVYGYGGVLKELWNINPQDCSQIRREGKKIEFCINNKWYGPEKIFYCYGPGRDGMSPRGRLSVARESIGKALAIQEYGARFFGQGTNLGGFISHPKTLTDPQYKKLKNDLNEGYNGLGNSHKIMFLEDGMKFERAGMSNEDAQFLETTKFQVSDIARFFNVKSHMLGDLERATFSNIEHQGIEAVEYCWRPRAVRLEQAINQQLLDADEKSTLYVEHNFDALMRGDLKSQVDAWSPLVQNGVINADEIRSWMNLNTQEGGQGSIYFMPVNMADKLRVKEGKIDQKSPQPEQITSKNEQKSIKIDNLSSISEKIIRNQPDAEGFRLFSRFVEIGAQERYRTRFSVEEYRKSVDKLMESQKRRSKTALNIDDEIPRMRNAFRYAAMQASGVTQVVWRSDPDCPHCQHLNGKVVSIGECFVDGIRHAPIAPGCNCNVEEA